ncbi:hypothetical protein WOLCODRAFT_151753 [Wolfiporia cocos MD-104 SS10]|uniref:Uncharacterized protein n=1 Tax=Wolfiporia cocos (strain MD-104) TaxID=742152 RepID=A0A2H3JV24_WOLCO|nr:hypothetical protein WOLCODRAFT_151753 [Wolfiporia cocos MD-104 SS10]
MDLAAPQVVMRPEQAGQCWHEKLNKVLQHFRLPAADLGAHDYWTLARAVNGEALSLFKEEALAVDLGREKERGLSPNVENLKDGE